MLNEQIAKKQDPGADYNAMENCDILKELHLKFMVKIPG